LNLEGLRDGRQKKKRRETRQFKRRKKMRERGENKNGATK
jgi:hypothetical protein